MLISESMKEFLDLDKRDREILSLYEKYPEMSQSEMAEKLKISQPSVSARIHKLKQKGALSHIVGMNLKKVSLYMAMDKIRKRFGRDAVRRAAGVMTSGERGERALKQLEYATNEQKMMEDRLKGYYMHGFGH